MGLEELRSRRFAKGSWSFNLERKEWEWGGAVIDPADPEQRGAWEEIRQLIENTEDLRVLYGTFGYTPEYYKKVKEADNLLNGLQSLLRAEASDSKALQREVGEVLGRLDSLIHYDPAAHKLRERLYGLQVAGEDQNKLNEILTEIYAEEWKRPEPHENGDPFKNPSFIKWSISDRSRFQWLLDYLADTFRIPALLSIPLNPHARQEVLDCIARIRDSLDREGDLWPLLIALKGKVQSALAADHEARQKKDQLDGLLLNVILSRKHFAAHEAQFKEAVAKQAKRYLETGWMHTPWLTSCLLRHLLDADVKSLGRHWLASVRRRAWIRFLRSMIDELDSSYFDGAVLLQRLLKQEEKGLYVHSLVVPLLRMLSASPSKVTVPIGAQAPRA